MSKNKNPFQRNLRVIIQHRIQTTPIIRGDNGFTSVVNFCLLEVSSLFRIIPRSQPELKINQFKTRSAFMDKSLEV